MHLFEPKSFTPKQESKLRDLVKSSEFHENFLTEHEFDLLQQFVLAVDEWPEHGKVSKYWGFGLEGVGAQFGWLWSKILELVPDAEFDFFAVQEAIDPWKIHADMRWYSDRIPYRVFFLPMAVECSQISPTWPQTHTLVFDQRNFLTNWHKKQGAGKARHGNDQSDWKRSIDDPQIEGVKDGYAISREIWQKYLTHLYYQELEGLTLDSINPWLPRSIMHWDASALHCADDFRANNIRTKNSFMVFTALRT